MNKKMKLRRMSLSDFSLKIIAYVLTIVSCITLLMPLLYLLSSSMKDDLQIYMVPPKFLPSPPNAISIVVDYTDMQDKSEAEIKDILLRDSTLSIYSTAYEINTRTIFNIDFFGTSNGKVIFHSTLTKLDLYLNLYFEVYNQAAVNKDNLLEKYKLAAEKAGYKFDLNGLDMDYDHELAGKNELNAQIKDYIVNKYGILGEFKSSIQKTNYIYAIKNYIGYWKVPMVMFSEEKYVSSFGYLWFWFNTIIIMVFAIAAQVIINSSAAYALSRLFRKKTAKILLIYILASTMIPFVAYMVPMYVMFSKLNITDTYLGMLLPYIGTSGFFVYLYKGFFDRLPKDLFESARIDGASEFLSFIKICMPLSKAVNGVIIINTILSVWNDFFWPYLIARRVILWPLNVALYNFQLNSWMKQNVIMGISVFSIIPAIILIALFSDSIKKGLVWSGIKG